MKKLKNQEEYSMSVFAAWLPVRNLANFMVYKAIWSQRHSDWCIECEKDDLSVVFSSSFSSEQKELPKYIVCGMWV